MKKILIVLLIMLCGCNFVTPEPENPENEVVYRALLVGVNDYIGCSSDLAAPTYAVDSMKELFNRCYDLESTILKDQDATKKNILDELWYTFRDAEEDDVSIFYWAGHGGDRYGHTYICPADTNWAIKNNITVEELEGILDNVAGTKFIILDTCHSGNFIGKSIYKLLNKEGYQVLTSCAGEQVCYYSPGTNFRDPYMIFTKGLLEGCKKNYLADINNDRIVTLTEVYNFAIDWVADNSNWEQDAQMYPDDSTFPVIMY